MLNKNCDDCGKLLLRLTVGGLMLFHGVAKVQHGLAPIEGMLDAKGLPTFLAYGAYVGELVAPLLIIVGLFSRFASLALIGNMIMAIVLAHTSHFFALDGHGGWSVELPMFFLLGAACITLLGSGRYAIKPD